MTNKNPDGTTLGGTAVAVPIVPDSTVPAALSRESILAIKDIEIEELFIKQWDMTVWVRSLNGKERDDYEESMVETKGRGRNQTRTVKINNVRASLAVRTVCNEDGDRIFNDGDVAELGKKNAAALNLIWDVSSRLSGITAEDVDELVGNSEADQQEPSSSS